MPRLCRTFWNARPGHSVDEYEDAFAVNEAAGRFAVADGASEGCFTGLWARLLVEDFARRDGPLDAWPDSLLGLQQRWNAEVFSRELPWYAEDGARLGASAAFLGLTLVDPDADSCRWQAVAVGDTCLFHTRGRTLLQALPLSRSEQFDNFPKLVGSRMPLDDIRARQCICTDGVAQLGDRLWIMTDALAQWCLAELEAAHSPWTDLESLLTSLEIGDSFPILLERLRAAHSLRSDDVTLLAIEL